MPFVVVIQPPSQQEEGLVFPVVEFGNDHRPAQRGIEVVIFERGVGGGLIEHLPVQPGLVDVTFLRCKVQLVCAALRSEVVRATG